MSNPPPHSPPPNTYRVVAERTNTHTLIWLARSFCCQIIHQFDHKHVGMPELMLGLICIFIRTKTRFWTNNWIAHVVILIYCIQYSLIIRKATINDAKLLLSSVFFHIHKQRYACKWTWPNKYKKNIIINNCHSNHCVFIMIIYSPSYAMLYKKDHIASEYRMAHKMHSQKSIKKRWDAIGPMLRRCDFGVVVAGTIMQQTPPPGLYDTIWPLDVAEMLVWTIVFEWFLKCNLNNT